MILVRFNASTGVPLHGVHSSVLISADDSPLHCVHSSLLISADDGPVLISADTGPLHSDTGPLYCVHRSVLISADTGPLHCVHKSVLISADDSPLHCVHSSVLISADDADDGPLTLMMLMMVRFTVSTASYGDCGRNGGTRPKLCLKGIMSIFRNLNAKCDGQTKRRTDGRTDGPCDHYMPSFVGIKSNHNQTQ
ncbi:hypothetical protein DPMN_103506 [Dreissena polymorpha]|uniref:Uncharacterized protein n=1 Tax=Dreissena polymorpha TaxID=45954 RepID=A0A9D4H9W1_DREPO|nr:hypothetical protein DPMN_103506 [Dreissena polymorpha]